MDKFVLKSSVEHETLTESLPSYLLRKAKEQHDAGKTLWMKDVVTGESHTFGDFDIKTRSVASYLYRHGMRKGDTGIYMSKSITKTHFFLAGIWRANGIARASYPEDDAETLQFRVEESSVRWIFCDPEQVELCREACRHVNWNVEIIVNGRVGGCTPFSALAEDDGNECPDLHIDAMDPALVFCTSGTTGRSKGAVHSHYGHLNALHTHAAYCIYDRNKPNLLLFKATHISGSLGSFIALVTGCTTLVMSEITKENLFESVHKYRPGFLYGFPSFLLQMIDDPDAVNFDFSSVNMIASGGAQITPAMQASLHQLPNLRSFVNVMPVLSNSPKSRIDCMKVSKIEIYGKDVLNYFQLYGLTESIPVAFEIDCTNPPNKLQGTPPFSVGKVAPGAVVTFRDPDTGEILGANQRGELCVKSERNFAGYLRNPQATKEAIIDGYFRTGDIGYFDENEFIFIVDRLKEIFKYYNNHVSPSELEDVLMQHEGVNEACVFGIPDPAGGDHIPRAVVTVKSENITPEEIMEFTDAKLADYKRIRGGVFIVDELPKGKTGKITRALVAKMQLPVKQ